MTLIKFPFESSRSSRLSAPLRVALAISMVAALAACGGGGGSDSTSSTSSSGGTSTGSASGSGSSIPTSGTLVASAPTPTYAAGSDQLSAYTELETARQAAGAGALIQSTQIDTAASAHATYLGDNYAQHGISHTEDPSLPGYYAASLTDRLNTAGVQYALAGEGVAGVNSSTLATGGDCVSQLLNSVYHLAGLLSPMTHVGIGTDATTSAGLPLQLCVVDMATASDDSVGQLPASGAIVAYPYAGQSNVPASWQPGGETPRVPVAIVPNQIAGTPIAISICNADYSNLSDAGTLVPTLTAFTLKDASGNLVPVAIITHAAIQAGANVSLTADTTGDIGRGMAVMVPLAALNVNATYTVTVAATLKAGGSVLTKTWSFSTGAN